MKNLPEQGDYINIHDHGTLAVNGVFSVDNIMVHEGREPSVIKGVAFTIGAHPWHIEEENIDRLILKVKDFSTNLNVIAIGEAGLDKLRGPAFDIQICAFEQQAEMAESVDKPMYIHCVGAWDEILDEHKKLQPKVPWIIHGFKGKKELVTQLIDKGFYLSPFVEWAIRPESTEIIRAIPTDRLFLETDGFDIDIEPVYKVVADHLNISLLNLKENIYQNFMKIFKPSSTT
jgi:TatD DNase family protein